MPAGTGRLGPALIREGRRYVAADISAVMLAEVPVRDRTLADGKALPFSAASFDVVTCCRLLHHLEAFERRSVVGELVRVARSLVIASFWDAASWQAWRRRAGLRRASHADTRRAITRAEVRADFEAAGARVLGFAASFRYVSPQTFVAARVEAE